MTTALFQTVEAAIGADESLSAAAQQAVADGSLALAALRERDLAAAQEIKRLRGALAQVRLASLLRIRQAAFAPEIGVRYTESIRADIANQCALLEQFIEDALAPQPDAVRA